MEDKEKLKIINREIIALGQYYRNDWSGFDGRTLRDELYRLSDWIENDNNKNFDEFTKSLKEQEEYF